MAHQRASKGTRADTENVRLQNSQRLGSRLDHPARSLLPVLPLIAAVLTAGSVFLHAIGAIAHRTFLKEMGVPPDLFPKEVAWTLINGYYALFDRWLLLFKVLADEPLKFILYSFVITVVALLYWFLYQWNPKGWEWVSGWSSGTKTVVRLLSLILAIVGTTPGVVCAVMLVMLIVGAPGEYAGKAEAEKVHDRYAVGCTADSPCTSVLKNGAVLVNGVVLDAVPSHIAIYDPKSKFSYVLETDGVELRHLAFKEK